jgi:soluble lytic murein transglycosylase-like protein
VSRRLSLLFLFAMTLVLTATALASANRGGERRSAQAGGPAAAVSSLSVKGQSTTTVRLCPLPKRFRPAFERASEETGIALAVLAAMARAESDFQPNAVSRAGARGLLQVLPSTAQEMEVNLGGPDSDVLAGARYLKRMLDRFDSLELALAAYNAGPTAVAKAGQAPSAETRAYVSKVLARWQQLAGCS